MQNAIKSTALSFKKRLCLPAFVACNENKAAFAKKTTTAIACRTESCVATQAGGDAIPQVGGLPFWGFPVAMIWRRDDPIGLPGLFGFGPKPGGFLVQKRNETPETLCVDVGMVVL